jgi:homoserine kinase
VILRVRAPATVANLGPGFDSFALALDLRNEFVLDTEAEPGVEVEGEGAAELRGPRPNLVVKTMRRVADDLGAALPPFRLRCRNLIPLARGLGSSATAVSAGVLLADRLLGAGMDGPAVLSAVAEVEGHADNAAACLRGGLVVVYRQGTGWEVEPLDPSPSLRPVVLVSERERVGTRAARKALPEKVALADAAFNAGRAALAVVAMTRDPALLPAALQDRLHQAARLSLAPGASAMFERLAALGFAVCVAGSGPSLLAFEREDERVPEPGEGWRALRPAVARDGATLDGG